MSVADGTYRVGDGECRALPVMGAGTSRPGGVGSVRFGAVTGRHRGQPKDRVADDEVDERSSRKWIGVVAGAFLVPVVVCSVVAFGLREEPVKERPGTSSGHEVSPVVTAEPTYGQFVAPEQEP